jgi:leader peptidase (prepilin peptidase) / N-methyltransferase
MEYIETITGYFAMFAAFVFGSCIGSFLNVLMWRLPREEKITGWSRCPNCNHRLEWWNLVPLFSYVAHGRKCQYCKQKISPRYFIIEFITGLLFSLAVWQLAPGDWLTWIMALKMVTVIAVCITVFVIDFEHYLILNKVVYPAIGLMLILNAVISAMSGASTIFVNSLLAAIFSALPFWILWKVSRGKWMGDGDFRFVGFMGLALGFHGILVALFISFTAGAIIGVALIYLGSKQLSSKVPFGTFLSAATIVTIFFGMKLWDLYWGLFL